MNGAGGANMATNAGGGGQLERQIPSFQQQWLMMQQQQAAQAAVPAVVPSAAPDTMQLILNLTQSVESLTKKVEGQQKSASRDIPHDMRVAMEKTLQVWQTVTRVHKLLIIRASGDAAIAKGDSAPANTVPCKKKTSLAHALPCQKAFEYLLTGCAHARIAPRS